MRILEFVCVCGVIFYPYQLRSGGVEGITDTMAEARADDNLACAREVLHFNKAVARINLNGTIILGERHFPVGFFQTFSDFCESLKHGFIVCLFSARAIILNISKKNIV